MKRGIATTEGDFFFAMQGDEGNRKGLGSYDRVGRMVSESCKRVAMEEDNNLQRRKFGRE